MKKGKRSKKAQKLIAKAEQLEQRARELRWEAWPERSSGKKSVKK